MANTNYQWAALVMSRCTPPITPTGNNTANFRVGWAPRTPAQTGGISTIRSTAD